MTLASFLLLGLGYAVACAVMLWIASRILP
jgi:hypothetical protein